MLALLSTILFVLNIVCLFPESHGLEAQEALGDFSDHEDVTGISVGVGFDLTASYG